ncbi:VQ motif containing protein [Trema orientale]|uniref:VQ motif containing protein n=1 Tax=Trema orientale TaxID=63057 RepID=A0A2P5EWZ6_TREOI|nr:VQ motif containing protein [Trema orientale]
MNSPTYGSDPVSPNTTFVQADPSTFRAVVQKLTGAPDDPSAQKLPLSLPSRFTSPKPTPAPPPEMGPRRPAFKLHERRQTTKKLELNLTPAATLISGASVSPSSCSGPLASRHRCGALMGLGGDPMVMVSPVSPFEFLARGSPRTPVSPCPGEEEEEERAIAEKGFYLHPSPLSTPRGSEPPELLPLFPLSSPRDTHQNNNNTITSTSNNLSSTSS